MERTQGTPTPVTKITQGMALVVQGALIKADGSHRSVVASIRRTAANTWLTFESGRTDRYSNRASVLVEAAPRNTAPTAGKPTYTGPVRGWTRY
jgi:hypothetical protein